MATAKKLLEKLRRNPKNCRIEQLETMAKQYGINVRKSGGSHVVFDHPVWIEMLCVPARRPIKPIYVKKFVALIDRLNHEK